MTAALATAHPAIVEEETLFAMSGYERRGDVENWLRTNGVRYFRGRSGRLSTTVRLLEASKGLGDAGPGDKITVDF